MQEYSKGWGQGKQWVMRALWCRKSCGTTGQRKRRCDALGKRLGLSLARAGNNDPCKWGGGYPLRLLWWLWGEGTGRTEISPYQIVKRRAALWAATRKLFPSLFNRLVAECFLSSRWCVLLLLLPFRCRRFLPFSQSAKVAFFGSCFKPTGLSKVRFLRV